MKLKRALTAVLGVVFALAVAALAACGTVEVAEVTLNETALVLEEGQSATLVATVTPSDATDKTVVWTSDNPETATVVGGTVTAVKKGTAKITATAGGKSAVCNVTVNEAFNLAEYKADLCAQIEEYKADSLYKEENELRVAELKEDGKEAVNAAADKAAADSALAEAKTAIDAVEALNITATVNSAEDILTAVAAANENDAILIKSGEYTLDGGITISANGVTLVGEDGVVLKKSSGSESVISVAADDVTIQNIKVEAAGKVGESNLAPVYASGSDFCLYNCVIERCLETLQDDVIAYGLLVKANEGVFTAHDCTFIAPYNPETAFNHSPSVIEATSGVDLEDCTVKTDGYAFFSQHLTKGTVKNTVFTGIDERPILGCNSTLLDGIEFDGCTFDMGRNSNVLAGSFTFKNCVFSFENTPANGAGNAINVYMQTGDVVIENNTFNLKEGVRGVNFTWADWAVGSYDGSKVFVSGNTFNGTGECAFRITERWENLSESDLENNNNLNGNAIITVTPAQ